MGRKYRWQDLAADADVVEPALEAPVTLADDDVASKLTEMPAEGPGDGSLELLRVARRAIGLGVERDAFVGACARWNGQRSEPWDEDDLLRRYDDARRRFDEEGLAAVPTGRYTRAALDTIVREDKRYAGRLVWDELEQVALLDEQMIDDVALTKIEVDVCRRYGFASVPREALLQTIVAASHERTRNRVTDYLAALEPWDGTSRDEGLVEALGVLPEQRAIAAVYLRKMRIAAVARAAEPGCKVDNMLILVGAEGLGKSTFFRDLAGPENFEDTKIDLDDKDAYMQLATAWFYEWSEIEAITRRADVARVKGFLSSTRDSYRRPYERTVKKHPRRGIIVGSSNSHDVVLDLDSDRRSWILEIIARIDRGWVRENRDQLWAEALAAYAAGEAWHLDEEHEQVRREVNDAYRPDDLLSERVAFVLSELSAKPENKAGVPVRDLYARIGVDSQQKAAVKDVNSAARNAGFTRARAVRNGQKIRVYLPQRNGRVFEVEKPRNSSENEESREGSVTESTSGPGGPGLYVADPGL